MTEGVYAAAMRIDEQCKAVHELCRALPRYGFPFDEKHIPLNGIYVLFEEGETGHSGERIVRIGSHTGAGQLPSRLRQHFVAQNKDRSIFRKHVGRCILAGDPYASIWEIDFTTVAMRTERGHEVDIARQKGVEHDVSEYLRGKLSFAAISVPHETERLALESAIIAAVAQCWACAASPTWLGRHSPVPKIAQGKLWLVQHIGTEVLSSEQWKRLQELAAATPKHPEV